MRYVLRPLAGLVLALVLALTGQSMAVARGASGPAGAAVLCTGTGPITVLVDENGQPTGPAHICPDCALSLFDALADGPTGMVRPLGRVFRPDTPEAILWTARHAVAAQARGPPLAA